jgi:dolichyl-diphosphooligosaccharide--protein glycosyltransferase
MADEREIARLLEDRPELAEALAAVLAVDDETDEWAFEDVPVGTGVFGEIVGQDLVEEDGEGYRVADPAAVRRVLADHEAVESHAAVEGHAAVETGDEPGGKSRDTAAVDSPTAGVEGVARAARGVDVTARGVAVALVVTAVFVAARALPYGQVFRDRAVVLTGNDPYFYRFWVEQLLVRSPSPVGLGVLADVSAPFDRVAGEPLLAATLWLVSALLGGTPDAAGAVLAWYPVVAGLAGAALVYVTGATVLEDRRIGALAAGLLAVMPAHAFRTSLGFADHHAFDYVWLLATAATLAYLLADDRDAFSRRWGAVGLGLSVAALTLAWEGAPLMLVPAAASLAVSVPLDVREGRSPRRTTTPVVAGLGLGAALALGTHLVLGWLQLVVAVVPLLLAAGAAALAVAGEVAHRRSLSARRLAVAELAVPVVGFLLATLVVGGIADRFVGGVAVLLGTGGIGETASAFRPGEVFGLSYFGLSLPLGLAVACWAGIRTLGDDRRWLVLAVFGWYFAVLAAAQVRFTGQLAPFLALFAASGVVWAAARWGVVTVPDVVGSPDERDEPTHGSEGRPVGSDGGDPGPLERLFGTADVSPRSALLAGVLVVSLVASAGATLPGTVTGATVPDRNYETAMWMTDYANERGWDYPDSYVFSDWGENRVFNYFVSGQSANYTYARQQYSPFISSTNASGWYERLRDRVGFVVLKPLPRRANTMQERLYYTYGSRWPQQGYEAVSHYRAVYASSDRANKVFVLVPGARIRGQAAPNATLELRTRVEIPSDSFLYRQQVRTGPDGEYDLVVPYPGEYEVRRGGTDGNRTGTVTVPEPAVRNGTTVRAG